MEDQKICNGEHVTLLNNIIQREEQENKAATLTSEILTKLNVNIEALPKKCQQILHQTAKSQTSIGLSQLDPIAISLKHSKHLSEKLDQEYEVLKLKQKNAELQTKIDRNNKILADLRKDLESSRSSLAAQNPNPENIQKHIRQLNQKVASYEESCAKAKMKYTMLSIPERRVLPQSLMDLASTLATLTEQAASLKQQADDVVLARQPRNTFNSLKK